MKLIFCLSDNLGISFNKRRQSRDSAVICDIMTNFDHPIYMSEYSAPLFEKYADKIRVLKCAKDCPANGYYFLENDSVSQFSGRISTIIIYRWNRTYPADLTLDLDLSAFKLREKVDFVGTSHDKITREIYDV